MKKIFLLSISCFTLVACQSTVQPVAPVDIKPLSSQIESLAQANADLRVANERLTQANVALQAEVERLKSVLRADAEAGKKANIKGWGTVVDYIFNHMLTLLPNAADEDILAKWEEAMQAYAAGGENAMQGVVRELQLKAGELNQSLGRLQRQVDSLTKERDDALANLEKAEQKVADAATNLAKAIADAKLAEAAAIRAEQVRRINQGALLCGALAILLSAAAGFSPVSKLRLAILAGIMLGWSGTLMCIARWWGSVWVEISAGILWAAILVIGGIWLIRRGLKEQELKAAAEREKRLSDYTAGVVDILNEAEKKATPEQAAVLKDLIWKPLKELDTTGELDVIRHDLETKAAQKKVSAST